MTSLDPISPFLALIDRLIELVQVRKTRKREYFEKIIDPLYMEFTPLGADTLALFRSAKDALHGPKQNKKAQFEMIRSRREGFSQARVRLRKLIASCMTDIQDRHYLDLASFAEDMLSFFEPAGEYRPEVLPLPGKSLSHDLVYLFHERIPEGERSGRYLSRRLTDQELEECLNSATARLSGWWEQIAEDYMRLKLKYTVE